MVIVPATLARGPGGRRNQDPLTGLTPPKPEILGVVTDGWALGAGWLMFLGLLVLLSFFLLRGSR
jgi:hypothetical protein